MKIIIIGIFTFVVSVVAAAPKWKSPDVIGVAGAPDNKGTYSIIQSQFASITDYPHTAAILTASNYLLGGGFIYRKRWVVTAAVTATQTVVSDLRVRVGSDSPFGGGQNFTLTKLIVHPKYNGTWDYDLALLQLDKSIKYGKAAKRIRIASASPKKGQKATVTGWGATDTDATNKLQYLVVDVFDRKTCNDKWYVSYSLKPGDFCAYKSKSGPCGADFGDPLISNGRAIGVYVGGFGCANDYFPSIYCDLSTYRKWIDRTIKKNGNYVDDDADED